MKVKEYLKQFKADRFFILDSHQEAMSEQEEGHQHADSDFTGYAYNIHKYNQLVPNSFFLYRRPAKLAEDKLFHIYGGGIIDSITEIDDQGNVIANVSHAFRLVHSIDQGDPWIEEFSWKIREKPGPGWKGFWVNYGMNKIEADDFWRLVEDSECEVIKEESTRVAEEHTSLSTSVENVEFTVSVMHKSTMKRRVTSYAKRMLVEKKFVGKIDYIELSRRNKTVGTAGELLVLEYENARLKAQGSRLHAKYVAETIGDGLGYDIISYDEEENEIHIEVKTTKTANVDNFYMSRREVEESLNPRYAYKIYRLYNFNEKTRTADLRIYDGGITEEKYEMKPVSYIIREKSM